MRVATAFSETPLGLHQFSPPLAAEEVLELDVSGTCRAVYLAVSFAKVQTTSLATALWTSFHTPALGAAEASTVSTSRDGKADPCEVTFEVG